MFRHHTSLYKISIEMIGAKLDFYYFVTLKVVIDLGNPRRHIDVLKGLTNKPCGGEPSLQNCLDLVVQSLKNMPPHTSR